MPLKHNTWVILINMRPIALINNTNSHLWEAANCQVLYGQLMVTLKGTSWMESLVVAPYMASSFLQDVNAAWRETPLGPDCFSSIWSSVYSTHPLLTHPSPFSFCLLTPRCHPCVRFRLVSPPFSSFLSVSTSSSLEPSLFSDPFFSYIPSHLCLWAFLLPKNNWSFLSRLFCNYFPLRYSWYIRLPGGSDGKECACNAGDVGSISALGRSLGEGHGYPLQSSCLENSVVRGAWCTTVHGVSKGQTPLSY